MKHTVLITGGAGYIGSHIALLLQQHGHTVIIIDDLRNKQLFPYPYANFIQADYGHTTVLSTIFSRYPIDAIIHCAASIEIGASIHDPLSFYENNVAKTIQLLTLMLKYHIKTFIFSSSCAVYGIPEQLPLHENHPKNPTNPYGMSKKIIEIILEDMQKAYGLRYGVLRYFNVAGALPEFGLFEQHIPETHLVPLLIQAALNKTPFTVFGIDHPTHDGTCIRDYVHVSDIAQAHLQALYYLDNNGISDCFNVGSGTGISILEMIHAIEKLTDNPITIILGKKRIGDPPILIADLAKAQHVLQWTPQQSNLNSMLTTALASYQNKIGKTRISAARTL